eukprot:TRINITY_DN8316_c0_g1_i1.p1 TRINITY_DN8316_c0_g1~~TRINITY_DN8316_c0_g1_i1.p1  ORF type:complete len:580 (+),score=165.11 TRINITY_DN8316_c0_g1_i1:47-1741(+)
MEEGNPFLSSRRVLRGQRKNPKPKSDQIESSNGSNPAGSKVTLESETSEKENAGSNEISDASPTNETQTVHPASDVLVQDLKNMGLNEKKEDEEEKKIPENPSELPKEEPRVDPAPMDIDQDIKFEAPPSAPEPAQSDDKLDSGFPFQFITARKIVKSKRTPKPGLEGFFGLTEALNEINEVKEDAKKTSKPVPIKPAGRKPSKTGRKPTSEKSSLDNFQGLATTINEIGEEEQNKENSKAIDDAKSKGNQFYKQGRYLEAIRSWTKAIDLMNSDPRYALSIAVMCSNRAAAHNALGQIDEALQDSLESSRLNPNSAKSVIRAASIYLQLGLWNESLIQYEKALVIDPTSRECIEGKINLKKCQDLLTSSLNSTKEEAYHAASSALILAPYSLQVVSAQVQAIMSLDLFSECSQIIEKFLGKVQTLSSWKKHFQVEEMHCSHVMCLFYSGELDHARKLVGEYLYKYQNHAELTAIKDRLEKISDLKTAATAMWAAARYEEALSLWNDALNVESRPCPFSARLYTNRANAFLKLKNFKSALKEADVAVTLPPGNMVVPPERTTFP